jgi:AraC-like DNA-binding protein
VIYDERPPPTGLRGIVTSLWFLDTARSRPFEKILPQPSAHLIVNLSAPYRLFDRGGVPTTVSDAFVSGVHSDYLVIESPPQIRHVGAAFTPAGLARTTRAPAEQIVNRVEDARTLYTDVGPLVTRLRAAPTPSAALDELASYLLSVPLAPPDPVAECAADALASRPETPVGDLAARLGVSHRTLIAHFRASTGLTPKVFAQVTRFHAFVGAARDATGSPDWGALATAAGYYDQPHVIRAFRRFTGWTPSEYGRLVAEFGPDEALFVPLAELPTTPD